MSSWATISEYLPLDDSKAPAHYATDPLPSTSVDIASRQSYRVT